MNDAEPRRQQRRTRPITLRPARFVPLDDEHRLRAICALTDLLAEHLQSRGVQPPPEGGSVLEDLDPER